MTEEGLRGWMTAIMVGLASGMVIGSLVLISNPDARPSGWVGVILLAAVLLYMLESVKKIGRSR